MHRISIQNHKGGAGKTTTTVNFAGKLSQLGHKVLIVDCDSQGDCSSIFLDDHESLPYSVADFFGETGLLAKDVIYETAFDNIWIISADHRLNSVDKTHGFASDPTVICLVDAMDEIEGLFDYVVFDCPPRSHLSGFAALVASQHILVPVETALFGVRAVSSIEKDYELVRQHFNPTIEIHYYLSRISTASKTQKKNRDQLMDQLGNGNVIHTVIPKMTTFESAINAGKPVGHHKPKSKANEVILNFTNEIIGVLSSHDKTHDHKNAA